MPIDWNETGRRLGGFGAGLSGRGAEWNYYQDRARLEEQKLVDQRRQEMIGHVAAQNREFLMNLQNGNMDQAYLIASQGRQVALQNGMDDIAEKWGLLLNNGFGDDTTPPRVQWMKDIAEAGDANFSSRGILKPMGGGGGDAPAEVQTFEYLTRIASDPSQPEQVRNAAKVKLGTMARAQGTRMFDMGGVMHTISPMTGEAFAVTKDGKPITPEMVGKNAAVVEGYEKGSAGAQALGKETLGELRSMTSRIRQYESARDALRRGADSGQIAERFPTLFEPTATLENIRNQLGINLIGATTFGNLSEGELQFALATMMPQGLDDKELDKWLQRKIAADRKLQKEIRNAAQYLLKPETTMSDFLTEFNVTYGGDQGGSNSPAPSYQEGQTATGPNGEKIVFRNGQWVRM